MRLDALLADSGLAAHPAAGPGVAVETLGDPSTEVSVVTIDSAAVGPGSMFACVPGAHHDGHDFAPAAVAAGAAALLCERRLPLGVAQVVVPSVRLALGPVCDSISSHPSRSLTVVGVTGTNGKTTTCALLGGIFEANGWRATSVGTLTQLRTTPEAPLLQATLARWRDEGGRAVSMEVSSHALVQHRTDGVGFAAGVFTNLTPEHLDYHRTMDAYFEAKALLFEPGRLGVAVVNRSDPWGRVLIERVSAREGRLETYGEEDLEDVRLEASRSRFRFRGQELSVNLGGRFNVLNAAAAAACAAALGVPPAAVAEGLAAVGGVRGRFEPVESGQPFAVVVDYAHTPDALAQALRSAGEVASGRVVLVFGAGGERDRAKRPLMGAAAAELADLAVLTSDNPRGEDPAAIIGEVLAGTGSSPKVVVEPDRAAAIAEALGAAAAGDVVLIAGKGHEKGQEIGGRTIAFDDAEVARRELARLGWTTGEPR